MPCTRLDNGIAARRPSESRRYCVKWLLFFFWFEVGVAFIFIFPPTLGWMEPLPLIGLVAVIWPIFVPVFLFYNWFYMMDRYLARELVLTDEELILIGKKQMSVPYSIIRTIDIYNRENQQLKNLDNIWVLSFDYRWIGRSIFLTAENAKRIAQILDEKHLHYYWNGKLIVN